MLHVEDREVDVVGERALDRFGTVADLGHDTEVGLVVEQFAQPGADDREVVGQQHVE